MKQKVQNDRAILVGPALSRSELKVLLSTISPLPGDFWIGVDGGSDLLEEAGIRPALCVGDQDSLLHKKDRTQTPWMVLPKDKNRSDLFYAVLAAIGAKAQRLLCLGTTGRRPDHHQAMLADLSEFSTGSYGPLKQVVALGTDAEYHFLSTHIPCWQSQKHSIFHPNSFLNQPISVFAVGAPASGVTLSGLRYELTEATFPPSSFGVSNEGRRKTCKISLRKGRLLIILPQDGPNQ